MQPDASQTPSFGLDDSVFMAVIDQGDASQRTSLAAQLASFLCNEEAPKFERDQVIPAVLKLMADPEPEVRATLVASLIDCASLHADILFAIIADDDEIAIPFLSATPALGHWHMLAVLRVGDDVRRAAVALRHDVSPEAVDYIIDSLPLVINLLMFENPNIAFTAEQFHRLYARFGETEEMLDCLLSREDLPLGLRVAHAKLAAQRVQQLIIERGWIPANDATELVADAEENAVLEIVMSAPPEQIAATVDELLDGGMLTPSIIVRAACLGAMDVVAQVMASLAGVSLKRASDMMFVRPRGSFKNLHGKSGLPQSCYWTLQAACDVAREELHDKIRLTPDDFGRRMIEVLLTQYETLPLTERPKQLDYVGRFAADRPRLIAQRLKADLLRAA